MASITKEIAVGVHPDAAWDAVRDIGAIHTRLAPGFAVDVQLEDGARIVTFGNGSVVKELIVASDDVARRLAWAIVDSPFGLTHHHGVMQVVADGDDGQCRVVWTSDLLPDEVAPRIAEAMAQGLAVVKQTLEMR